MTGRPTTFTPEMMEKANEYLENYDSEHSHSIPSAVGLAVVLNVARSTLYKWAEDERTGFSDILDKINDKQQMVLLAKGLSGDFSAAIAKLVLGKHGYHEVSKVDANINDYSNMSSDERQRKLQELQQQLKNER